MHPTMSGAGWCELVVFMKSKRQVSIIYCFYRRGGFYRTLHRLLLSALDTVDSNGQGRSRCQLDDPLSTVPYRNIWVKVAA